MPAAAVIPAPIAYMNVVAVKTLVVDIIGIVHLKGWISDVTETFEQGNAFLHSRSAICALVAWPLP